jgi:hypothetical protein
MNEAREKKKKKMPTRPYLLECREAQTNKIGHHLGLHRLLELIEVVPLSLCPNPIELITPFSLGSPLLR